MGFLGFVPYIPHFFLNANNRRAMNENERSKAERHVKKRGLDLDTYLEKKHGQKAAEFARQRDLAEYLVERQMARRWKSEKLKKKWHDVFGSSSSDSEYCNW